jgi:hypothetical protein
MQYLRAGGWVKAIAIPIGGPVLIAKLLKKGWIEKSGGGRDLHYRITDKGLAAKKLPISI